jgi:hypothetical protein
MRPDLRHPPVDTQAAEAAVALAQDLYRLYEAGQPFAGQLDKLAAVCGTSLTPSDLSGAFGSIPAESFAMDLLLLTQECPSDLSREDLLDLIQAICEVDGEEWQIAYWLRCVEKATGSDAVSDLIYYPGDVLGREHAQDELSPEEILEEAYRRPVRVLVTPPPKDGSA